MGHKRFLDALQIADTVRLLREHFDATTGRYNEGWSDVRIGEQIKGRPEGVGRLRVQHFGKLAAAPKPDVATLMSRCDVLENDLESLGKEHDQLVRDFLDLVRIVRNNAPNQMSTALLKTLEARYAHVTSAASQPPTVTNTPRS